MQIGGVNSFIYQLSSLFQKRSTSDDIYEQPSGEITINSIIEKLSIDKKTEAKRQELERILTGFGKEADEYVKKISEVGAQIYKAALEKDLANKIKEMNQKEQANKIAAYQSASLYQYGVGGSSLNLYS